VALIGKMFECRSLAKIAGLNTCSKSSHIAFLTNLQKKAKPENEIFLSDIQKHKVFEIMLSFAL